jgi:poly-gamma-glutamate synthesis protein (capsule biosynthesis protein)
LPFSSSSLVLISLLALLLVGRLAFHNPSNLPAYPWLYLRGGEPLSTDEGAIELVAIGDVMLGRGVADEPRPFAATAPWLRAADLTVGNLECVITSDAAPLVPVEAGSLGPLQTAPSAAYRLREAGFDVLGLGNNHALDLGTAGLAETAYWLRMAGIAAIGAGPDPEAAFRPLVREIHGVRLAFLAVNAVTDDREDRGGDWAQADWDSERIVAAINAARDRADAVVVLVHWGYEYETRVDPVQRDAARLLLQAGADLVIGHHPHVVQTLEISEGQGVAYSLGNFVFDQGQGETAQGLALRAFFDGSGLRAMQAVPVWAGARPRLMTLEESRSTQSSRALIARVTPSQRLSVACDEGACRRVDVARHETDGVRSALFWGGQIDLSGDGVLEHVRRVDEQLVVYGSDVELWRSPTAWRVVDAALGDPNNDGRGEILLALWKTGLDGLETPSPDKERTPRSHPFIVGYRGGIYRTLWGGSAVRRPIHEVELGDVDGDGMQELIVLEGEDAEQRTIAVWRWHGWGFSLLWRSDPGGYRGLKLSENGTISVVAE